MDHSRQGAPVAPLSGDASAEFRLSALDAAELGTWFWDLSSNRVSWDEVGRRLLGLPPARGEITFEEFFDLLHPDDRFATKAAINHAVNTRTDYDMIHRVIAANGSIRWLRCKGRVDDAKCPIFMQGVTIDISWLRLAQESLRRSERMSAESQLALQLAHEINNPLEILCNSLYLLQNNDDGGSKEYALTVASSAYERIAAITSQMLRLYSKPQAQANIDLAGIVQELLGYWNVRAEHLGISLQGNCASAVEFCGLESDVYQVLDLLLDNAIEHTPAGGRIVFRIKADRDRGRAAYRGIRLTVADSGCGVPPDIRPRLFQPFTATAQARGLGLWTCSLIANRYGGSIRCRTSTEAGRSGSSFSVFLRSMDASAQRARSAAHGVFPVVI